ncbi:chromate transporter [Paenibacillus septentrionalis]|uniref:Chromate transporter n=1 Tax=Paenibacillus septentrionalis TaxID=429342 RepID=A0ABW1V686_9BACL|nr:chromate transporter [Escherichia coli]
MNKQEYWNLTAAMLRTGLLGYGGGPSTIPLFKHEAVDRYQWMDDSEFAEVLAIANTLPGPIATKLAAYLGYQRRGILGAVLAVASHILPTCIAIIALFSFISVFSTSSIISGMIAAVVPVVCVMLAIMAFEFGNKAVKGLGYLLGFALLCLAFILLYVIQLHPAIVIVLFLMYGAFHFSLLGKMTDKQHKRGVDS